MLETLNASGSPDEFYAKLLDSVPFLRNEDKSLYRQTFEALASEMKIESWLDLMELKDYVDKLLQERRYNAMIVDIIEDARTIKNPILGKNMRGEVNAATSYLPLVEPLNRLEENAAKARRASQRDLRRMIRKPREIDTPSIVPGGKEPDDRK